MKVWLVMTVESISIGVYDSIEAVIAHHPNTPKREWRMWINDPTNWVQFNPKTGEDAGDLYAELFDLQTVETVKR